MQSVKLELTFDELTLLASLASDQLFRREFIDPKMPGYKADPVELHAGKALVGRLQLMIGQCRAEKSSPPATATHGPSGNPSRRRAGSAGSF